MRTQFKKESSTMPRGVYDRSKSKEQREAEKTTSTKPTKTIAKVAKGHGQKAAHKDIPEFFAKSESIDSFASQFNTLQSYITTLENTIRRDPNLAPKIVLSELGATFENLSALRKQAFSHLEPQNNKVEADVEKVEASQKAEKKSAQAPAPVVPIAAQAPAPVHFNQPPNGAQG